MQDNFAAVSVANDYEYNFNISVYMQAASTMYNFNRLLEKPGLVMCLRIQKLVDGL